MSYQNQLVEEINGILDRLAQEGKVWKAKWIAHEVCKNHEDELLYNADFSRHNNYVNVRREVNKVMKKKGGLKTEKTDNQLVLDGFEHVQKNYMVERDGEDVGVPTYQLTKEELLSIKERLEKMAKSTMAHADEVGQLIEQQFPNSEVA